MDSNSVIMQWNLDEHGNPTSLRIDREVQQVSTTHNLIQLVQIPDGSQRIIILMVDPKNNTQVELQEVLNKKDLNDYTFYVEYGMGLVLFTERWQGCTAYVSYYGRGVMLISDSRIFHKNGSTFYDTYDNIIDRGLDAIKVLDAAGGLQGAIDRLDELKDEGNAVADRLQEFITETQFYGYTIVLSREAFVVKSDNDGLVEPTEVNGCYTDVIAYQGAKQVAPVLSVGTSQGCVFEVVEGYQRFKLKSIEQNVIKAQANVYLDFGDGLIAQRTLEVTKVFDGVDPYQVEMTNPFLAIETSQDGNILDNQEIECEVTVTKTGEPIDINAYTVEVQNAPLSLYHEVHENKIKFSVRSGSNFPSGTCLIVVKVGRQTFNKTFAWSMVKSGHDAKSLVVVGNQVLRYQETDYSDIPIPSRCVVTAQVNGLSGTPVWYRLTGDEEWEVIEGQNSTTLTFSHDDIILWGNRTEITVRCELDGYSDELTIVKLTNGLPGSNSITIFLTNESVTIPMNEDGEISEYDIQKCFTRVKVFDGLNEIFPIVTVPTSNNYQVSIKENLISLVDIERSSSTVDIDINVNINGIIYTKIWSIGKARQGIKGDNGQDGSSYSIVVEGGTNTITYAQINSDPRPAYSEPFIAYLYKDGQPYDGEVSWYWSTSGHLNGTGINYIFTPGIAEYFDEAVTNNSITVSATCEGARVSTIIPVSITKDAAGLDWVAEWDGTKTEINDTTVLTPKLFAGIVEPNEITGDTSISGVAVGSDVLNNGTTVGIVGYQQDKVSFLLDVDGTLQIGNFYEPDGVGIIYDNGKLDIKVSEMSITGSEVATKDDIQNSVDNAMSSAKAEIDEQLQDVMGGLNDLDSFINGALQDGIFTDIEKAKFESLYENVEQETVDVTSTYLSITSNEYFTNEELQTLLSDSYAEYITNFDLLTTAYHEIMAGGLDLITEETDENGEPVEHIVAVENFNEALAEFRKSSESLRQYLNDALLNITENQTNEKIAQARLEITQEIKGVSDALTDLDSTMNNEFKTGLITYINQKNLDAKLNQLELEKIDIDAQYNALYNSKALKTSLKSELAQAKAELDSAHDVLIARITSAIADALMTETELSLINSLIDDYAIKLDAYSKKAQECNVSIAQSAVDNMTQQDVFNKLTNNGEVQGIFLQDKQLYINGEYVNTRNLVAVTDENVETFKVDEQGNVHITAKTFTLASDASTNLSEFLNLDDVEFDQETIFNALTNGGASQGIYMVNGQIYINGQYINAKGLSVTNKQGVKTLEIDADGNVNIVANSFSVAVGGTVEDIVTKDELDKSLSDAKQYTDAVVNGVVTGSVNVLMSNPVQVVATNVSYYPLSAETYTTTLQVFQGATEITNYTIGTVASNHGFTVSQTSNSISFTTSKTTKISESGSFDINITVDGVVYRQTFNFTAARQGEAGTAGSSCSVNITATSNIFKSGDGGLTFSPNTITLTPTYQNLTHANWLYSIDGGTTWVNVYNANTGACVGGITSSNHVLTIPKGCTLFTDEITSISFKALATDESYYDIVTIIRLYDTAQLEVGGTNLLPDSTNDLETWGNVTSGYLGHNAILLERSTTGNTSRTFKAKTITEEVSVKTGETYTLSAMVYVDSKITLNKGNNNIYMRLYFDNGNYKDVCACQIPTTTQTNTWVKVSKTEKLNFSSNIDSIVLQIALQDAGSIKTSMIQLERGNVATDWKPSPKDSFNTKEVSSLINQTKESIELSVSSKYTTQDAFNSLSVGGRNFALNTSSDWLGFGFVNVTPTNYCIYNINVLIDGEVGDVLTYRLELRLTGMEVVSGKTNGTVKLQGSGDVTAWNSGAFSGNGYVIQPGDSNITIVGKITLNENHLKNSYWKTNLRFDNVINGNVEIRNYMFEKGTLNSSWSPAPEDVLNSISTAKQEAIDSAVATSTTNMNSRLNSYSTTTEMLSKISASKEEINSSVSKTYETKANATTKYNGFTSSINSLTTRMNTAEQKITSDAIINTVSGTYATKTEVQNIQVGGVNRIPNSAPTSTSGWSIHTTGWSRSLVDCSASPSGKAMRASLSQTLSTGGIYKSSLTTDTWEHGEQYTISCYMRASTNAVIGLTHDAFTNTSGSNKNVTTEWQYFTTTGTYNQNASYKACTFYNKSSQPAGFWFEIHSLKVEKGNKPTDWSPAPEDTINSITSLENRVSTAEQKITEDAIISTVSSTYVKKTDFDNMTIGGENLIVNSDFEYGFEKWQGSTSHFELVNDNYYSLKYTKTDLTEAKNYQVTTRAINVLDLVGKELTLTFDYKIIDKSVQTNTTIAYIRFFDANHKDYTAQADSISATNVYYPSNYTNNTRATAKKTVTVPTGAAYVRVGAYQAQNGDIRYSKFQLEVGNKPTTWKASSQDALLYADQATTQIDSELQDLTSIVSLNNGSDALTPQLKVKLVAEYKDAKSLYDNLSDMYKKVGITNFANLMTNMTNAHTTLSTAITNMEKSGNVTDESGLSAILNKFNAFYESADALNQAIINGLKGVTDELSTSIEQLSNEVNIQIGSFNTQLGQITTRFTFGTDGLTIKSTANATKYIKLDNDSLDFMDNGTKVAEITNQQLNISKATITNEMKIGNMKIKPSGIGGVIFVFE